MPPESQHAPVSVVMPVHNALPYLDAAIQSILDQSFRDFEFVIYDDGSTDGSTDALRQWAARDERIRLVFGTRNLGPAGSSNFVVEQSTAPIVARMDADDISHPDRLAEQIALLEARPGVALVGTLSDVIDSTGRLIRGPDTWRIRGKSWFAPFPHGSIMYHRTLFQQAGGYRAQCEFWEDQDLFLRIARLGEIVTIPRALYQHRQSQVSTRLNSGRARVENAIDLMFRCMARLESGQAYDDLIAKSSAGRTVDPRAFISIGSLQLWSGGRPRLFRRLIRSGRIGLNLRSALSLLWTAWASISPGSLRGFLGLYARWRNARAGKPECNTPVPWQFPGPLP